MGVTLLIALALHGGIAMWLTLPLPSPPQQPPAPPLRISLLATIAETTMNAPAAIPEAPPEPISKPVPVPVPVPEPRPVIPEAPVQPLPEPPPPTPRPLKSEPEPELAPTPEPEPEPRQEIVLPPSPVEPSLAPLDAAATAQYEQLLVAWLEKHKKYPRRAKRLRIEGEGMLRILIDRTGQTQRVTLEQHTGNRLLDQAALEMAQRADPFPPIPGNDPRRELEFIVPVAFVLH